MFSAGVSKNGQLSTCSARAHPKLCTCHHVQRWGVPKCVTVMIFSASASKVCNCPHVQRWGVQKCETVIISSADASKSVQLSSCAALGCLQICKQSTCSARARTGTGPRTFSQTLHYQQDPSSENALWGITHEMKVRREWDESEMRVRRE
jgi:hypothetical protein